jgi:hypothetical protein
MSMPRSNSRSSTFLSDSGNFTYITTTSLMTSGEELKQRNGLDGWIIPLPYAQPISTRLNCSDNSVDGTPYVPTAPFGG